MAMYRISDIQESLMHLVGWRQDYNPDTAIGPDLTTSESGLYFQDAHPLVTLDNVRAVMPEGWLFRYPEWNMISVYRPGDKVRLPDGTVWVAVRENSNRRPEASDFSDDFNDDYGGETYWVRHDMLNDYLSELTASGIAKTVQTFITMKTLSVETRSLVERRPFFDGAGRLKDVLPNRGSLVGFEIIPVRAMGVTTRIERIGLQMTGGTGMVSVFLFHSGRTEPLRRFDLDFSRTSGGFQWFEVDGCFLPYDGPENSPGGSWYLCYNQGDLPAGMQAVNMARDWSREPCGTCNPGDARAWREITRYMQVSPFSLHAPSTFREIPEMWDLAEISYTNTVNWGLNCMVSVGCDLTDFIVDQRQAFQTVLQLQVAADVLRTLAMNPDVRVNRRQLNVDRNELMYEIDGDSRGTHRQGIGYRLEEAYRALSLDTGGLSRVCLKCNNRGVKYTTA